MCGKSLVNDRSEFIICGRVILVNSICIVIEADCFKPKQLMLGVSNSLW